MFEPSEYLLTILRTMQDALMVVDDKGKIVAANPAMETLTGFGRSELIGASCAMLECTSCREERSGGGQKHCALFALGGVRRRKCEIRRKDRSTVTVLKNAAVLRDGEGEVLGGVETLTDLTELSIKEQEITQLRRELGRDQGFEGMLGRSTAMSRLYHMVESAAQSEAPVLITGETGTGKELVGQAIHRLGRRARGPYVRVNCAAFSESLLESEFFGHVRGAFTGAEKDRVGRFEAANGGDFLLDEIGDMSLGTQVKLLRLLQEKNVERVGDNRPVALDVRILSATNRDLRELIREGRFREDLYYRVAALPVRVPPLRDRREDIPLLLDTFLRRACVGSGKPLPGIDQEVLQQFARYDWPGNVRELMNAVEYAVVMAGEGPIRFGHLPPEIADRAVRSKINGSGAGSDPSAGERERLSRALEEAGGKKAVAARLLGVSRVTLWKRLKACGFDGPPPRS